MTEDAKPLKEKLEKRMQDSGKLNAADVANFARQEVDKEEGAKEPEGPVEVPRSTVPEQDGLLQSARTGPSGGFLSQHAEDTHKDFMTDPPPGPKVKITPEDREAFMKALVSGNRFSLVFPIFDGDMTITVRTRTQLESQAIISRLKWELDHALLDTQLDYTVRLRSMLLAAQIQVFNDTEYETLAEPLKRTEGKDGVKEPGWIKQADRWQAMDEASATIAHNILQEFESKYWTMIENANDQNFWNPAASTSE